MQSIKRYLFVLSLLMTPSAVANEPLLKTGDRVTMLGGTFVERMQIHGHFEAEIRARLQSDIRIKNLGWAGDNVLGESRAVFGTVEKGMERLLKDMRLTNPTVIIIFYGGNEAHHGNGGVEPFRENLQTLLTELGTFNARLIVVGPRPYENLGPPLPSPRQYNNGLTAYRNVLRAEAERIEAAFIDLATLEPLVSNSILLPSIDDAGLDPMTSTGLTSNGVHLTSKGYQTLAPAFATALGLERIEVSLFAKGDNIESKGLSGLTFSRAAEGIQIAGTPKQLLVPRESVSGKLETRLSLRVEGLRPGKYRVIGNGVPLMVISHTKLAEGASVFIPANLKKHHELLHAITTKNMMFFHRHRPQNETYLFLFRKHEQGNNAGEVPQFDPFVEDLDKRIYELCKPQALKLTIQPVE